ncbi:hypothetical protein [Pantoea rwandensis]|uniref:VWFA domain-containing protein n=1 Tax=Pantoea rwandensis TaxID=1076550 RepID=A0A1X1D540_9GAMM|nr:hypothetical protein [Pantoea rwandensis]ORM71690.1 hypothetical protein HA51_01035 [Pantoea rwandensis]
MSFSATKKVDLVIVIDTSNSMADEATALSEALNRAIEVATASCPSDLRVEFLGIEGQFKNSKFEQSVRSYLNTLGVAGNSLKGRVYNTAARAGAQEDVARAVEDVSQYFDWRDGAERNLFVLGDESLEGGDMVLNNARIEACNNAIKTAIAQSVKVHTYLGTPHESTPYPSDDDEQKMIVEYKRLALRTGGEHYIYTRGVADFTQVLKDTICAGLVPPAEAIAEKQAEADRLEGKTTATDSGAQNHQGSSICEQAPEIIRAVNTLAGILDKLVDACGPKGDAGSSGGCRCNDHDHSENAAPHRHVPPTATSEAQLQPTAPDFVDATLFTDGNWNNWQAGEVGHDFDMVDYPDNKTKGIYFKTAPGKPHAGVILQKSLSGLQPNCDYIFMIRTKRVIAKLTTPKLSLRVDGKDITDVVELTVKDQWVTLQGQFTAVASTAKLEVVSHENDSNGNDYHVGRLVIANPGNAALTL